MGIELRASISCIFLLAKIEQTYYNLQHRGREGGATMRMNCKQATEWEEALLHKKIHIALDHEILMEFMQLAEGEKQEIICSLASFLSGQEGVLSDQL